MLRTAHWTVEIFLEREPTGTTVGEAILLTNHGPTLLARGHGRAHEPGRPGSPHTARTVVAESLTDLVRNLDAFGDARKAERR